MNVPLDPRLTIGANHPPLAERLSIEEAELGAAVEAVATRANLLPRVIALGAADTVAEIGLVVRDALALARRVEARRVEVKAPYFEAGTTIDAHFKALHKRAAAIAEAFTQIVSAHRAETRAHEAKEALRVASLKAEEEARERAVALDAERKGRERSAALAHEKADQAGRDAELAESLAQPAPLAAKTVKVEVAEGLSISTRGEWTFEITRLGAVDLAELRPYLKPEAIEAALRLAVRAGVRQLRGVHIFQAEKVRFS